MNNANHDKELAQKAMDKLLVDLLIREQTCKALRVTRITRLDGDRPCWHLWTEDNQGVYQLELQDVGQVPCGGHAAAKPFLEMEADFVIRYFPSDLFGLPKFMADGITPLVSDSDFNISFSAPFITNGADMKSEMVLSSNIFNPVSSLELLPCP